MDYLFCISKLQECNRNIRLYRNISLKIILHALDIQITGGEQKNKNLGSTKEIPRGVEA